MTRPPDASRFLRAAVKTALRLQRASATDGAGAAKSDGVATMQRIKASLRKRQSALPPSS
jgi:hypothetical protein